MPVIRPVSAASYVSHSLPTFRVRDRNGPGIAPRTGARALARPLQGETHECREPTHGICWAGGATLLPAWMVGRDPGLLDATDVIWEFFATHPRGQDQ